MPENDFLDITPAAQVQSSYIKVIGVGGAGTNAVNHMYNKGITGVDFIVCNTDEQSLNASPVNTKIKIGEGGLGAGNKPEVAQKAAVAASDRIKAAFDTNTHMLFIAAGMGGGTGTGASPEIAKIAKEIEVDGGNDEILVVAVVTIPFSFEGRKRREQAKVGIENLKKVVDSIIIVNTDKLKSRGNMGMKTAFALADDVLLTAAKGISEIMTANAYIHVDFRDVQSVMQHSGVALMGSGIGEGQDRAYEAIKAATTSDLLNDNDLQKTQNILLYISYSSKEDYQLQTEELSTITNYIEELTNADVDMIWGCGTDDSLEGKIAITLVATGFESQEIYHSPERSIDAKIPQPVEPIKEPLRIQTETFVTADYPILNTANDIVNNMQKEIATKQPEAKETEFKLKNINEQQPVDTLQQSTPEVVTLDLYGDLPKYEQKEMSNKKPAAAETKEDIIAQFAQTESQTQTIVLSLDETEAEFDNRESSTDFISAANNNPQTNLYEQPMQASSLKDLTGQTVNQSDSQQGMSSSKAAEVKQDRIKRIHDLLKAGKVNLVQSLKPNAIDFDEKLSSQTVPDVVMTVSKDGNIAMVESPVIGSQVD
ncbi:MAG: cell division protein FtsZ [Bacteroidales bacterium]|nr:cell division protein FtsZ [Bacteroidales bacterium]